MENVLLNYFIRNEELISTCDFNTSILTEGPGIYEVIRLNDGKPLFLDEHLNRFHLSARHENFSIGFSLKEIKEKIRLLISHNRMKSGNIRFQFILHPRLGNLFLAWAISYNYPSENDLRKGVRIVTVRAMRENPQSKRTNLPVRIMAENLIEEKKVAEVLMINDEGMITEGSRSNIFFIRNKNLYTPKAALVLQGITREKIMKLAKETNTSVREENIHYDKINDFEACFLSSTSKSVLPVSQIDDQHFKVDNQLMRNLMFSYDKLIRNYQTEFKW
jgi:branched-chain amino acid aminotransferase